MIKNRDVFIVCCEGEAEINLFGFLKSNFYLKNNKTLQEKNIKGFNSLSLFQRKSAKIIKGEEISPRKKNLKFNKRIHFLFLIDKDLKDSDMIGRYVTKEGHFVQFCNPNTEAILLGLYGVNIVRNINEKDFRKRCKDEFEKEFKKSAHKMKDAEFLKLIPNELIFKNTFPELHRIFNLD